MSDNETGIKLAGSGAIVQAGVIHDNRNEGVRIEGSNNFLGAASEATLPA